MKATHHPSQHRTGTFRRLWQYWIMLGLASFLMAMAISAAHAQLSPGNILVIDKRPDLYGLVFQVGPATSARKVIRIRDLSGTAVPLVPQGVAVDALGNILVLDLLGGVGRLISVNPTTGVRTVVSDFGNPAQGPTKNNHPDDVAVDSFNILVIDSGWIVSVDPSTGFRTVVSDFRDPKQGTFVVSPDSLAVDTSGNIFFVDNQFGFRGEEPLHGAVFKVDPNTGKRTVLSRFRDPAQGTVGQDPRGIALDASGNIWVTGIESPTNHRVLFSIDPNSGFRTVRSDFSNPTQGPEGVSPEDVAIAASGNILVIDSAAGMNSEGMLLSVNPNTGARTVVSDFGNPAQGTRGVDPEGVAIAAIPPTQPVDLTIANMEITQAIQNLANDVPLVQDKTTYVRVYPKVDIADRRVGARLRGFRGGLELPGSPLRPLYPLASAHTTGAKRKILNDSFNFWIPPAWRSGTVTFQAEINFGGAVPETNTGNNVLSVTKEFMPKAPVCALMIPVHTHGSRYTVNSPGFNEIIERFTSLWPVPKVKVYFQTSPVEELQARVGIPPWEFGPYELPEDTNKVLIALILRSFFSTDPIICQRGSPFRTVGMVSPDTNTQGDLGAGGSNGEVSWVKMEGGNPIGSFSSPPGGITMAHEMVHNFGDSNPWKHVKCDTSESINPDYPYPPNQIGPDSPDAFWGFDPITSAIITPTEAKDFMSYCSPAWVSDYTWKNIFSAINVQNVPAQSLATLNTPVDLSQSAEILVVSGIIKPSANTATFDYGYRLSQDMISADRLEALQSNQGATPSAAAIYTLDLVDAGDTVLLSLPFEPIIPTHVESVEQGFFLTVPFDPKTQRVRITHEGRVLGALAVSANAPEVKIIQPSSGETITDRLVIQWEATDKDSNPLLYTIQYSPDLGASWQALVTQSPETKLSLDDTSSLPGSDQALIRVIASDGVNTGSDTSAPFTVQAHVPIVHINTPGDGAIFGPNSQIILTGAARDTEDGSVDGEGLKWLVNGEVVGSGEEVAVGGLATGTYDVTLKAVDRDNNIAAASVTIIIVDTPVASPDNYTTPANTPLTMEAPGVLGNDTGIEGLPLSAVLVTNVGSGTLTLGTDGSFAYTPQADFNGVDHFTYKANDGTADSNVVTVSLTTGIVSTKPPVCTQGDLDCDEDVDRDDLSILLQDRNKPVSQSACRTRCDLNGDGVIDALDARKLTVLCTRPQCATEAE